MIEFVTQAILLVHELTDSGVVTQPAQVMTLQDCLSVAAEFMYHAVNTEFAFSCLPIIDPQVLAYE